MPSIFLDRIYNLGTDINHWMKGFIRFTTHRVDDSLNTAPVREHKQKEKQHEAICHDIHDIWAFRKKYRITNFCVCEGTGKTKFLRLTGTLLKEEEKELEESECDSNSNCGSAGGTYGLLMSDDEFEDYPLSDDECS
jgi:hypothetical protein